MTLTIIITCWLVLCAAVLAKAILGFGDSLLAIPLLTLVVGIKVAAPLTALMACAATIVIIIQRWREIDLRVIWRLLAAAVIGVPLGTWGIKLLPEVWVTRLLGALLILIGLYYLWRPTLRPLHGNGWAFGFGFAAGLFGGAYNMASPPVIVYGATQRWPPDRFRVTLQSFFLPVNVLVLISHASAGLWTGRVFTLLVIALPVLPLGLWIGQHIGDRLPRATFERLLYVALIVLGMVLVV